MPKVLAVSVLAILLLSGAAADSSGANPSGSPGEPERLAPQAKVTQLATCTVDGIDGLAFASQEQAPRQIPALSRTDRSPRAVRHTRTGRGPRRSTTSTHTQAPSVMGLRPSESRLQTLRAALPPWYFLLHDGTAPRAPALS
jgi:hypothetical protein